MRHLSGYNNYTIGKEDDPCDDWSAWKIAKGDCEADWEQTDNGHDWTVENCWEITNET